ncbi:lipase, partial [Streptomyces vinaceusdrappus]
MKVTTAALPLLPVCQRLLPALPALPGLSGLPGVPGLPGLSGLAALPGRLTGLSMNLLKASALEVAILAGHL